MSLKGLIAFASLASLCVCEECPNKVLSGSCFFPFPSVVEHNSFDDGKQKLRKNISVGCLVGYRVEGTHGQGPTFYLLVIVYG